MTIQIEEDAIRQENNTIFLPDHFWNVLKVQKGEKLKIGIDEGKYGLYVAIYNKSKK